MFFFQWPVLPELFMCSDDTKALEVALFHTTKHGTFSLEDIEAFKYTLATYGAWDETKKNKIPNIFCMKCMLGSAPILNL